MRAQGRQAIRNYQATWFQWRPVARSTSFCAPFTNFLQRIYTDLTIAFFESLRSLRIHWTIRRSRPRWMI